MTDRKPANQANYTRISDALIASGAAVPMDQVRWTDFPIATRMKALRILPDEVARIRAEERAAQVDQAAEGDGADKTAVKKPM